MKYSSHISIIRAFSLIAESRGMHEGGLALVDFALRKHPTNAGCWRSEGGDSADKMIVEGRYTLFLPYSAFYVGFDSYL